MFDTHDARGAVVFRVQTEPAGGPPREVVLSVGDLIGRHEACALPLHHPRAPLVLGAVVRRGRRLFLEGQGARPEVGTGRHRRVRLVRGESIALGVVTLDVVQVFAPTRVLAVSVADFPFQELVAPYYALKGGRRPDLLPGEIPDPDAEIVNTGSAWQISVGGRPFDPLVAGRVWQVAGTSIRTALVDTRSASTSGCTEPLVIESSGRSEHVRIRRARRHRVSLRGRPAQLLRHAAAGDGRLDPTLFGSPTAFSRALEDLADALRAHGLRDDLVRADGLGGVELFLSSEDRVEHTERRETG